VPVVASNFPELVRVIDKYQIGCYCNVERVDDLSSAIRKMISMEDYTRLENNLRIAKETLCWEKEQTFLKDEYVRLILNIKKRHEGS
jgi:hypothetical protein